MSDADDADSIIESLSSKNGHFNFNCLVMYPLQKYHPKFLDLAATHWARRAMTNDEKVFGLNLGGFGFLNCNEGDNRHLMKRFKSSTFEKTSSDETSTSSNEDNNEEEEVSDTEEQDSNEEIESDDEKGSSDDESKSKEDESGIE